MADSVIHFEIPLDDTGRGQTFYQEVFGWDVRVMPDFQYALATTSPVDDNGTPTQPGAINGGLLRRQRPVTTPVITIGVADIDATLATIESLGGSTVRGKEPVADMGFAAYFTDSEGNLLGLWQNAS